MFVTHYFVVEYSIWRTIYLVPEILFSIIYFEEKHI